MSAEDLPGGDPVRGGEPWRAAVVVFVEVLGRDWRGPTVELPLVSMRGRTTVTALSVMEVGMAAGNGYFWTRPTAKAWHERGNQ